MKLIIKAPRAHITVFLCVLFAQIITANTLSPDFEPVPTHPMQEALQKTRSSKKDWTFITYMSADNDLAHFSRKNLAQQAEIGSNEHINLVVHLDTRVPGNEKITKRYYIEKDKLYVTNQNDPNAQKMNSGDPETLIDCCRWAIENFPAHNYALIFWNHGTGIIDLGKPRAINPSELFLFNSSNNLIELDRSVPFLDFMNAQTEDQRGICFDDSTGQYLTNQNLDYALDTICRKYLQGKKFSLIGFDACLMNMLEVANIVKPYADIMVGSQEVELGTGWNYQEVLHPFLRQSLDKVTFSKHICAAYETTYSRITNDYTQSSLDLARITELEEAVNAVALTLLDLIKNQRGTTVRDAIKTSRHKLLCTHFDEPSYLDLHHLFSNFITNLSQFECSSDAKTTELRTTLAQQVERVLTLIDNAVIANVTGKNLNHAQGISIYFPERRIHNSYRNTNFAATNKWPTFLSHYLSL